MIKFKIKNIKCFVIMMVFIYLSNIFVVRATNSDNSIDIKYNTDIEYILETNYNPKTESELNNAIVSIEYFKDTSNYEYLYKAIDHLYNSYGYMCEEEIKEHRKNNKYDYIFFSITNLMLEKKDNESFNILIYLSDTLYKTIASNRNYIKEDNFIFRKYITWNYENSISTNGLLYKNIPLKEISMIVSCYDITKEMIENVESSDIESINPYLVPSEFYDKNYEEFKPKQENPNLEKIDKKKDESEPHEWDWNELLGDGEVSNPSIDKDEIYIPSDSELGNNITINVTDPNKPGYVNLNGVNEKTKVIYYQYSGGKCYKVVTSVDNKVPTQQKYLASTGEFDYCDVNLQYTSSIDSKNTISEYGPILINDEYNIDDNISDNNISYTVEKEKGNYAKYKNTKIPVTEDLKINYKDIVNTFDIMATQEKGSLLTDEDATILLMNGKPYGVKDNNSKMSEDDINKIFGNNTNMGISVDKVLKNGILESNNKRYNKIFFNGREITLNKETIIMEDTKLYPLGEISKVLGLQCSETEKNISIKDNENEVVYYKNKDFILINNNLSKIATETVYTNDEFYGELVDLIVVFGFKCKIENEILYIS